MPIFNQAASGGEIRSGSFTGTGTDARTIVTGLTKPIKFLWILLTHASTPYYAFKDASLAGDAVVLPASTLTDMATDQGATFSGSDFIVDATFGLGFNADTEVMHWIAFA